MIPERSCFFLLICFVQFITHINGEIHSTQTNGSFRNYSEIHFANGYLSEICKYKVCIPKCCPEGQVFKGANKVCTVPKRYQNQINFTNTKFFDKDLGRSSKLFFEVFAFVSGIALNQTFNNSAFDYAELNPPHKYYLTEEGVLYEEAPNRYKWRIVHDRTSYCVDFQMPNKLLTVKKNTPEVRFFTVAEIVDRKNTETYIRVGVFLSCFFLLLVLIVYSLLPDLRNLTGMVVMGYVSCLLAAFALLSTLQSRQYPVIVCKLMTFSTYFFFLASFCWMNIMSCDIWWTFRGYAKARPIHRRGEKFKFMMYCIYALGVPAALTVLLIILNEVDVTHIPWLITPKVPKRGCFLEGEEKFLYLYCPMLIMIVTNWVFFCMTAFNIWRLHRATAVLDSAAAGTPAAHRSQRYRFLVYVKLSVIMGINWILEVLSSYWPDFQGWYITDIYNALIGLSIFLIFVCKPKIFRKLKNTFNGGHFTSGYSRSKSRSNSNTTESDISQQHTPVCANPKGPIFFDKR